MSLPHHKILRPEAKPEDRFSNPFAYDRHPPQHDGNLETY